MSNIKNLTGEGVNKGMDHIGVGTAMTGDGIDFYRLLQIHMGLKLQKRGMKLSGRPELYAMMAAAKAVEAINAVVEELERQSWGWREGQDAIEERKAQGGCDDD